MSPLEDRTLLSYEATLSVASAPATAYFDQAVTFTVIATAPDGLTIPQGSRAFVGDYTDGDSAPFRVDGGNTATASVTVTGLPVGNHTLTVSGVDYTWTVDFVPCTLQLSVVYAATITDVLPTTTPTAGLPMTLGATITNTPDGVPPTGTMSFYDGVSLLGTVPVVASGSVGTASLTIQAPAAGPHRIRAWYTDPLGYRVPYPANEVAMLRPESSGNIGHFIVTDGTGNVFDAAFGDTSVYKAQPDGTTTTVASSFSAILGLAADQMGHLFVEDYDGSVTELNTDGTGRTSVYTPPEGVYMEYDPLAVDSSGDLFLGVQGSVYNVIHEIKPGPDGLLSDGTVAPAIQVDTGGALMKSCAVDNAGNMYVNCWGTFTLFKVQPDGTGTWTTTLVSDGFASPHEYLTQRIAIDPAGDLLVPDGVFSVFHPEGNLVTFLGTYSYPSLLGGSTSMAVDPAGNVFLYTPVGIYRVDMTPNLTVNPMQSSDVQTLLDSQSGAVTIQPTSSAVVSNVIQAVNGLSPSSGATETVTLDLGGNTFTTDTKLQAPSGVKIVIQDGTLVGGSPALVINSGDVTLRKVTARNATNAPTIVVNRIVT